MLTSRNYLRALAGVGLATVTCKALAALQQLMLARSLGPTELADAFFLAQVLPVLLSGLLYSSISVNVAVLLSSTPMGADKGAKLNGLLWQVGAAMTLLAVLILCVSLALVHSVGDKPERMLIGSSVGLQTALLPILLLQPLSGVLAGAMQSDRRLATATIAMIIPYACGIGALALTQEGNPYPFAAGLVLGSLLQLVSLVVAIRIGGTKLTKPVFGHGLVLLKTALPGLGCGAVSTLYLVSDRAFAATFGSGQVAAISFIYSLVTMPTQIVVNTVVGVNLPQWAGLKGNAIALARSVGHSLCLLSLCIAPISILFGLAAEPITGVLLGATAFSAADRDDIAGLLSLFAIAALGFAIKDTFTAALVAQGRAGSALVAGLTGLLTAWAARSLVSSSLGMKAAALSTTLGLIVCATHLSWNMSGDGGLLALWRGARLAVLSGVPGTAIAFLTESPTIRTIIALASYGVIVFGMTLHNGRVRSSAEAAEV